MNKSHEEVVDIVNNCYDFFSKEIKEEYKEVVEGFYNLIIFEIHNSLVINRNKPSIKGE